MWCNSTHHLTRTRTHDEARRGHSVLCRLLSQDRLEKIGSLLGVHTSLERVEQPGGEVNVIATMATIRPAMRSRVAMVDSAMGISFLFMYRVAPAKDTVSAYGRSVHC